MKKHSKELVLLLSLSAVATLSINLSNLYLIKKDNPDNIPLNARSTFQGVTVFSVDNEYYITPPENFISGKGWKRTSLYQNSGEPAGKGGYFRRTPGYSLWYLLFRAFLPQKTALLFLVSFQVIIFLLSVYCIFHLLLMLGLSRRARVLITLIYGCAPWFSSNTFVTLTEALSPYLVIFLVYFLFKAWFEVNPRKKLILYLISSFFLGYSILTRPYTGLAAILLPDFLWRDYFAKQGFKFFAERALLVGLIPLLMLFTWAARNYVVTGEVVILEKDHYPESLDPIKPEFKAIWNFTKSWGASHFWEYQTPLFVHVMSGETDNQKDIDLILNSFPDYVKRDFGEEKLRNLLMDYRNILLSQEKFYADGAPMPPFYTQEQLRLAQEWDSLTKEFRRKYPFQYYVIAPLKYLKRVVLHSNTSGLHIFQAAYRHITPLNVLRYLLLALHVALYLNILLRLFWLKEHSLLTFSSFVLLPLLLLAFFIFYYREIEQRYMLPYLPLLLLSFSLTVEKLVKTIEKLVKNGVGYL